MIHFVDRQSLNQFWREFPALGAGISALFGALSFLEHTCLWFVLAWLLFHLALSLPRGCLYLAIFSAIFLSQTYLLSADVKEGKTEAVFSIHSVKRVSSPFHQHWEYKGHLLAVGTQALRLPCKVMWKSEQRPSASSNYLLKGTLHKQGAWDTRFYPGEWKALSGTWSLAEFRYAAKERLKRVLEKRLSPESSTLMTALFTGDLDDRMLRYEFGRVGLQHILAISGFHFAIVASFAAFALRALASSRKRLWLLLLIVFLYYLFVGNSPSVQRSFLAASLFLLGRILQRRTSGLNLLGACLLFEILLEPLVVKDIGFQLSFLSCFALLLFYPLVKRKARSFQEAILLHPVSIAGHLLHTHFSRGIALSFAVNLALWPLLLHHFHRFPLLSLFYNLFIPQLAALALFLLLLSLSVHFFVPIIALPLFAATDFLAKEILEIVGNPPALLDIAIAGSCPAWLLAPYLAILWAIATIKLTKRGVLR